MPSTKISSCLRDLTLCICTINLSEKFELLLEKYDHIVSCSINHSEIQPILKVLIVDDCSDSSHTLNLNTKFLDIYIIRNERRLGLAMSRNIAINAVTTKWLLIADDDDVPSHSLLSDYSKLMTKHNRDHFESICFYGTTDYAHNLQNDFILSVHDLFLLGFTPPVSSQFYKTSKLKSLIYAYHGKTGIDHSLWISLLNCNANILVSSAKGSYMNQKIDFRRMTFNNSRIKKIIQALENWRPVIVKKFSVGFYTDFKLSTLAHVNYKILSGYYRSKNYSSLILCVLQNFNFLAYKKILNRLFSPNKFTRFYTPYIK